MVIVVVVSFGRQPGYYVKIHSSKKSLGKKNAAGRAPCYKLHANSADIHR